VWGGRGGERRGWAVVLAGGSVVDGADTALSGVRACARSRGREPGAQTGGRPVGANRRRPAAILSRRSCGCHHEEGARTGVRTGVRHRDVDDWPRTSQTRPNPLPPTPPGGTIQRRGSLKLYWITRIANRRSPGSAQTRIPSWRLAFRSILDNPLILNGKFKLVHVRNVGCGGVGRQRPPEVCDFGVAGSRDRWHILGVGRDPHPRFEGIETTSAPTVASSLWFENQLSRPPPPLRGD